MIGVLILSCIAFLTSACLTRCLYSPDSRLHLLDHPNERSLHTRPTPRTGGIAILIALFLCLLVLHAFNYTMGREGLSFFQGMNGAVAGKSLWILGMVLLLSIVSFADDRLGLSPIVRFGIHGIVAAGIVWWGGVTLTVLSLPILGDVYYGWVLIPLSILLLMWMTNLYNFMDGMDGFAGGMTVIGFSFLAYLGWSGGHPTIFVVSLLMVSASAGFLLWNFPPAKIFLGDVGSTSIGFLAGGLSLLGVHDGLFDLWVPMIIFSPFIVDATSTLFRRLIRGQKVWRAHREHYYQRLVLAGWGHRKTVLAEYGLMTVCGGGGLLYQVLDAPARLALLIGFALLYLFLMAAVCGVERRERPFHGVVQEKMDL